MEPSCCKRSDIYQRALEADKQKHTSITDIGLQEQNHEAHHKHAKVKIAMLTKTWIKVPI